MKKLTSLLIILLIISLSTAGTMDLSGGKTTLKYDRYYNWSEVTEALNFLHEKFPTLTDVKSIGKSEEGRDIRVLMINNPQTGKDLEKPGVYVDGAIHGNEIQATEVCLYLADYLLTNYVSIPIVKELVDSRAFYIIPVVNVDNRARFFEDGSAYFRGRTAMVPYDDDRDGLFDEDDYEDLDGDGEVLRMRIKDPFGEYKTHPDDPRVMVRVKPGEKGEWTLLGREGIDNDGDGELNEDGAGYLDMNRNYGYRWQPRYIQSGAGDFPMSGKVTKAISSYIMTKPNICFNMSFHNSGGMILRGPGSNLDGIYSPKDIAVYDFLGEEGEKIIPGYRYLVSKDDLYTTHGDFDGWMFCNLGIYGFVGELFMSEEEQYRSAKNPSGENGEDSESRYYGGTPSEERQKFNDFVNQGILFKEWTKFNHPQFGEIEIGGWRTFTTRIPPTFMLLEMAHRNASFTIFIARNAPEVKFELIDVKSLGDNLHRIRVRASNPNAIPTLSNRALQYDIVRKDIFSISGDDIEVVSGGIITDLQFDQVDFAEYRPNMIFTHVPSFGKREIQWIVKGKGEAEIDFNSVKAANTTLKVKL